MRKFHFLGWICFLSWLISFTCHPDTTMAREASSKDDTNVTQDRIEDLRALLQVEDLRTPRILGRLIFDGKIDEAAWSQAAVYVVLLETYPARLEAAPVKTLVRIGRYEEDIVVAFDAAGSFCLSRQRELEKLK